MSRFIASAIAITAAIASADQIDLRDGGRLTGQVRSISPSGEVVVALQIAAEPIELRADHVKRVTFSGTTPAAGDHDASLTLINGDVLPCDLLEVGEKSLKVSTSFAGTLEVPREAVDLVQLGMRPRRVIYAGPEGLGDWEVDSSWHGEEDALVSDGRGSISQEFEALPDSYSLAFKLAWTRRPNFQVYFGSDTTESGGGSVDRYYIQFGPAGLEIKRQSASGSKYQSLASIDRSPETFATREIEIDVRVDHRHQMLHLYIDGELEGRYPDPIDRQPTGKHVIFHSNVSEESGQRVSDILIREWDASGERHRSEDRGDPAEDALIDNEGQRFGGRLLGSRGADGDRMILFKSPHFPDALEIPADRVSTLFFSDRDVEQPADQPLVLSIQGNGTLGAGHCNFSADEVELTHPLLGGLRLKRNSVSVLLRRDTADSDGAGETTPEP